MYNTMYIMYCIHLGMGKFTMLVGAGMYLVDIKCKSGKSSTTVSVPGESKYKSKGSVCMCVYMCACVYACVHVCVCVRA